MVKQLTALGKKSIRLAPVRPNVGIEMLYQSRIDALLERMRKVISRAVEAAWRRKPPEMLAQDESPAAHLRELVGRLASEWEKRFDDFAQQTGRRFAKDATEQADRAFAGALRKAGFTVKFKMTAAANDIMQATITEQVGLIKSIPTEYLTQVQGIVMRGVIAGRDMHVVSEELQKQFRVTKRRAALIARDQNNKATAAITRARQQEIGITQAIWLHSRGGKHPRPSHLANDGKVYDVRKGWFDPDEKKWIWPGVLINCRCVARSIIPGTE